MLLPAVSCRVGNEAWCGGPPLVRLFAGRAASRVIRVAFGLGKRAWGAGGALSARKPDTLGAMLPQMAPGSTDSAIALPWRTPTP